MIISVENAGPRNTARLDEACRFFADQLLHPRTVQKLEIDIEVVRSLDVSGECISEDEKRNPRYFTIRLKQQQISEMIKVLGHEMVHVKQYAKNELSKQYRLARGGVRIGSKWHGEWWDPKFKEDAYWDSPWEIEAYGREVGLFYKWVKYNEGK